MIEGAHAVLRIWHVWQTRLLLTARIPGNTTTTLRNKTRSTVFSGSSSIFMSDLRLTLGSATGISLAVYMVRFRYRIWHGLLSLDGFISLTRLGFTPRCRSTNCSSYPFIADQDLNHTHITKVTPSPHVAYHRPLSQTEPFSNPPQE